MPVRIAAIETVGHLDTGSVLALLLPLSYADRLETTELVPDGVARSANTELALFKATIREPIVLAGNTLTNVEAVFSDAVPWVNIGAALLRDFVVSIDQTNRRVRLEPADSPRRVANGAGEIRP